MNDELEKAADQINKAKEVDPNNALVGWNEARVFMKNKNITDAIAVARDTNRRFPDDAEGMGVLGACFELMVITRESLYFLNNAIELNPKYTDLD